METQSANDDWLVARAKRGDQDALTQIYRRFEAMVYSTALRFLGNSTQAMDALQDSFVAAFKAINGFKGEASLGSWLKQIVINRCLRELRDRKLTTAVESEAEIIDLAAQLEREHDLQRALQQLPDRTRAVVWLYFVEGYSHQEIAESFGQSTSFSKSQVQRGGDKLRALMAGEHS
jgi:RNA polymerase sigma factor (sigma-70 family)